MNRFKGLGLIDNQFDILIFDATSRRAEGRFPLMACAQLLQDGFSGFMKAATLLPTLSQRTSTGAIAQLEC